MSQDIEEYADTSAGAEYQPRLNNVAQKYIADLKEERLRLGENFPLCAVLIDEAVDRIFSTGRIPGKEYYADVYKQKPIKITQKVFVPVKQFPKFNFTGKILGPKGNSLRRLQEETQCRITVKGRNSIRDRAKEEEYRNSGDPRYSHLHKDLFLEISTVSSPAESYARVAYALAEIRKYLVPDKNDEISHEQLRELMEMDPNAAKQLHVNKPNVYRSVFDKPPGGPSGSKYMSMVKPDGMEKEEEDMGEGEYEVRMIKRPPFGGYDHLKARPAPPHSAYKRQQPTVYPTDMKRLRETPPKSHKPNSYPMMHKYK